MSATRRCGDNLAAVSREIDGSRTTPRYKSRARLPYGVAMQEDLAPPGRALPTGFWSADEPPARSPMIAVLAVGVGIWMVIVTVAMAVLDWYVGEAAAVAETFVSPWLAPISSVVAGLLVVPPAMAVVALARRRPAPGSLAAGWAWLLAGSAATVLGCVRATPLPQNEILLGVSAIAAGAAGFAVRRLPSPLPPSGPDDEAATTGPARPGGYLITLGLLVLMPWLADGTLGGVVETVLAGFLAAAVGYLVTGIVTDRFLAAFERSRPWQIVTCGLATGVALDPVAAAVGGQGVNLAELLTLPALGFGVGAVAASGWRPTARHRWPLGALIGLAVLGPIAFVDPEETSLVLGTADVGSWALQAAVIGLLAALGVDLVYAFALRPWVAARPRIAAVLALVMVAAAGLAYAGSGRPGFYGERLLVVMAEQADLGGLSAITDRTARLTATYDRLVRTADRTQAPLRRELDRFHIAYTPYYLVNAILVDAGPALRPFLSGRSDVDRVLLEERLRPLPEPAPQVIGDAAAPQPGGEPQWNIRFIGATNVWSGGDTGQGITIGSVDSGVDGDHPALVANNRGGDDSWYDPWNHTRTPTDHVGHGTHTMGTAVGRNGIGVAPGARWVGCVALDRDYGSPSHYLDCLQFMLAPFPFGGNAFRDGRPQDAPDIVTNSWGCPLIEGCDLDALLPATAALTAAGIYLVAAAGNTGPGCTTVTDPPASYPGVMTVGATTPRGNVADFSSRGPAPAKQAKPDLVAPGVDILSALPINSYGRYDGTSMAAPHVAGVVALMWSANRHLIGDIDTTSRILRETARPVSGGNLAACGAAGYSEGAGIVDASAAVAAAKAAA